MEENKNENLLECRNCKSYIKNRSGRCPYCGILNPTVKVPEILKTIAIIVVLMMVYTILK